MHLCGFFDEFLFCKHIHLVHRKRITCDKDLVTDSESESICTKMLWKYVAELVNTISAGETKGNRLFEAMYWEGTKTDKQPIQNYVSFNKENLKMLLSKLRSVKYTFMSVNEKKNSNQKSQQRNIAIYINKEKKKKK